MKAKPPFHRVIGVIAVLFSGTACTAPANDNNSTTQLAEIGPLEAYYQRIFASPWTAIAEADNQEAAQALLDEGSRLEQNFIAQCMAEHGFNYIPIPDAGGTVQILPEEQIIPHDTREFAENYGFGISREPNPRISIQLPIGVGALGGASASINDPNQVALNAMSESELAAWNRALRGWGTPDDRENLDPNDITTWGCRGKAWDYAQGGYLDLMGGELRGLREEIHRLREQIQVDPRILEANTNWFACMAAEGFDEWASPSELETSISADWAHLMGWDREDFSADWEGWTFEQHDAFREREVTLAVASWDCKAAGNYFTIEREVDFELQQQFLDRNRGELERWAQLVEESRNN